MLVAVIEPKSSSILIGSQRQSLASWTGCQANPEAVPPRGNGRFAMGRLWNRILHVAVVVMSLLLLDGQALAQTDSGRISKLEQLIDKLENEVMRDSQRIAAYEKSTFYLLKNISVPDSSAPKLKFGGYVDAYYAWYRDSTGSEFSRFATMSPRNNQLGLNMLYFSAQYSGEKARGTVGLHFGDIAMSSWDQRANLIQEANIGLRLHRKLWVDGGFFRTHIGVESIQPRENITASISIVDYFEPYFLSGVKLSFNATEKLLIQVQAFNGYNNFFENNRNKALGASIVYAPNDQSAITFNTILSDESPDTFPMARQRMYNNLYYVYHGKKVELGAEANFGFQTHSGLADSTTTGFIYSGLIVAKYKFGKFGIYGRGEFYQDRDEVLTGPIENPAHQLVGINLLGGTVGVELKPISNAFLRLESRYLHTAGRGDIFYWNGSNLHYRLEIIAAMGVWF